MTILIVGAGPTGLTLACELARHGVACRIVDAAAEPCTQSRALGIQARTMEQLEMMGVVDKFLEVGNKITTLFMYDNNKKILQLSLNELDSPYPFGLLYPQSGTERLLTLHLEQAGVNVERNISFTGLTQSEESVAVVLTHADGKKETSTYDWVVGCDGAHSAVRHALNAPFEGSAYSQAFAIADVAITGAQVDPTALHMFSSNSGLLGIFPFGHGRARVIAELETTHLSSPQNGERDTYARLDPPTLAEMQEFVVRRGPNELVLSDPVWLTGFRIQQRQVKTYRQNRVFLAGDSAHIHSPAGGQGMNTGMQDAFNLAWKLALTVKGTAKPLLLDSYSVERHAVGRSVLKLTDFLTKVNTLRNPVAKAVRNRIAPILAAQEVIQERARNQVAELGINYRTSPIVSEHKVPLVSTKKLGHSQSEQPELAEWFDFNRGLHAGDRMTDVQLHGKDGNPVRLFELLRSAKHHLFLLTGVRKSEPGNNVLVEIANFVLDGYTDSIEVHIVSPEPDSLNDDAWTGSHLIDEDLSLHHRFGAASESLYLLRPDGYMGFRSLPADKLALDEYLSRIFV